MTASDWCSILALMISSGGFAINARNWFMSGPKLSLSVMGDAVSIPNDGKGERMALTVYNRGTVPTQITHMVVYAFDSRFKRWNWENPIRALRSKASLTALVGATNVPAKLDINAYFLGQAMYTPEAKELRAKGQLYIGVISAHSNRNFIVRVPPPKPDKTPKDKLPAA